MAFVLDASVAMSWCFVDESTPYTRSVLDQLIASHGEVPALWPVEIANSLAVNERKKRVTEEGSAVFLRRLAFLDIRVQSPLQFEDLDLLLGLARRHGLTAYDAGYLALAKRIGLPLATFDKQLIRAAPLEGVPLIREAPTR